MKILQHIPRWVKSKYMVVILVFLLFTLFLDNRNIFNQYSWYREMTGLEKEHRDLTVRNRQLEADNRKLQTNTAEIEKVAREKYHMKRRNEVVFLFPEADAGVEK
jgi:cell division protein DivIC